MEDHNSEVARCFCYALFKPDVVLRNIVYDAFALFEVQQYFLVDYRCGLLTETQYELMYDREFLWHLDFWAHNAQAYSFGPVIGAVFWYPQVPVGHKTAQKHLAANKGAALPENLKPGTIREQLKVTSRVFNVLHVPDTFELAYREASSWFGQDYLSQQLAAVTDPTECRPVPCLYAHQVTADINSHGYLLAHKLNGHASYVLVKQRFLHALSKQLGSSHQVREILLKLRDHYDSIIDHLIQDNAGASSIQVLVDTASKVEIEYLNDLLSAISFKNQADLKPNNESNIKILQLIIDLNLTRKRAGSILEYLWYLLKKQFVFVSDLEKYLIQTAFMYPTTLEG